MKNRCFLGLKTLNLYFIKFRQNSGSSEADDISDVSEPLGESCAVAPCRTYIQWLCPQQSTLHTLMDEMAQREIFLKKMMTSIMTRMH